MGTGIRVRVCEYWYACKGTWVRVLPVRAYKYGYTGTGIGVRVYGYGYTGMGIRLRVYGYGFGALIPLGCEITKVASFGPKLPSSEFWIEVANLRNCTFANLNC